MSISDIQKVRALRHPDVFILKVKKDHWGEFLSSLRDSQPPPEEEEELSTSPGVSEFVSDAFDSTAINQEDLRKEMEQLVLDKKESAPSPEGELQKSLC